MLPSVRAGGSCRCGVGRAGPLGNLARLRLVPSKSLGAQHHSAGPAWQLTPSDHPSARHPGTGSRARVPPDASQSCWQQLKGWAFRACVASALLVSGRPLQIMWSFLHIAQKPSSDGDATRGRFSQNTGNTTDTGSDQSSSCRSVSSQFRLVGRQFFSNVLRTRAIRAFKLSAGRTLLALRPHAALSRLASARRL